MANVPKFPGTGLEDVNVPGQTYLRDSLTSCTDPLKAIETFQVMKQKTGTSCLLKISIIYQFFLHYIARKWYPAAVSKTNASLARFTWSQAS